MVRDGFLVFRMFLLKFYIILFLVHLNSTITLSSLNWVAPPRGLQEEVVGDLSESNLDKTFNLGKEN